jgi:xylulokinase
MNCMGLDIGTSGCKAVVFDAEGRQLSEAHREYETLMPRDGWAELDSSGVLDACEEVMAEAAAACHPTDPVRAIGVSSQGEAFTTVGKDGQVLTNAMVSFDTRAAHLSKSWSEKFGKQKLYKKTGHTAHPMFTLFKILWVRDNLPDVWEQADHFYCFEELLHNRLGLQPAISYPLAGRTMMFNVRTHQWDSDILHAVGLEPNRLARPLPAGAVVGALSPKAAAAINVAPGAVLVAGGHDQPCGALGAGVVAPGRAMYGMGTVECICPAFAQAVFSDELYKGNLCTYDFTAKSMYTTVAFSLTGGNLLRWYRDEWAHAETAAAHRQGRNPYEAILETMPDAPSNLLVLPYFTPTGTPYFDPDARGAILGLTLGTHRGELLKALLEGVTLEMKLNIDILENSGVHIDEFIATGGGARSRRLTQLKADVLNRPITRAEVPEAGCLGVAMLAYAALTQDPIDAVAARWVQTLDQVVPNHDAAARYEERFEKYKNLYPAIRDIPI